MNKNFIWFCKKDISAKWLCSSLYEILKRGYKTISHNQAVLKMLDIFMNRWLFSLSVLLVAGVSFFDSLSNCKYRGEVYLYFIGLLIIGFSLSGIIRLFPLYKKRIIAFSILCLLVIGAYLKLEINGLIINAYFCFSLGACSLSALLILYEKGSVFIPLICMVAQAVDSDFMLMCSPVILTLYLSQCVKNKITDRKKYMIPCIFIGCGLIMGIILNKVLLLKIFPFYSKNFFLDEADISFSLGSIFICSLCYMLYHL